MTSPSRTIGLSRGAAVLSLSTVLSQAITWVGIGVISRWYLPEEFGVFGTAQLVAGIGAFLSTWRLDQAAVVDESDDVAALLVRGAGLLVAIGATVFGVVALGWLFISGAELSMSPLAVGALLLGPLAAGTLATNWATRSAGYSRIAAGNVLRTLSRVAVMLAAGLLGAGAIGLLVAEVAAQLIAALVIAPTLLSWWRSPRDTLGKAIDGIAHARVELRSFVGFGQVATGLNLFGPLIVGWTVAERFGFSVGGSYLLMLAMVSGPVTIVGSAIGQVVLGDGAAADRSTDGLDGNSIKRLQRMLIAGSAVFAAIGLMAAGLVVAILGLDDWPFATFFLRCLVVQAAFRLAVLPLAQFYVVRTQQRTQAIIEAVRLALIVLWVVIAVGIWDDARPFALGAAVLGAAAYVVHWVALARLLDPGAGRPQVGS